MNKNKISHLQRWGAIYKIVVAMSVFIAAWGILAYHLTDHYADEYFRYNDQNERKVLNSCQTEVTYRENLDKLFEKWDNILDSDRTKLRQSIDVLSTNVTVWCGMIAAICTIVSIVLGINANKNFEREIDRASEDYNDRLKKQTKELAVKQFTLESNMKTVYDRADRMSAAQVLSDLSVHLRVIAELQEFEAKDKGMLTKPELILEVLKNLNDELKRIGPNVLSNGCDKNINISMILMLCMFKRLLVSVEGAFDCRFLITLQQLRAKIDKKITKSVEHDVEKREEITYNQVTDFANDVYKLFVDYMEYLRNPK